MLPWELPPTTGPLPPWELIGGILAGVAALITAIVGGAKVLGELRQLRKQSDQTAADAAAVLAQQHPNHGGSMRDGLNRVEALITQVAHEQAALRDDVSEMRTVQQRQDAELARVHRSIGAVGERITVESARTAHNLADHAGRIGAVETQLNRKENRK